MITLGLYTHSAGIDKLPRLYLTYFRTDKELAEVVVRITSAGTFNSEGDGRYLFIATFKNKETRRYFTNRLTYPMHVVLSYYAAVFRHAYQLAEDKMWPFAWQVATEKFRIARALDQLDTALALHTMQMWGG